MRILLTNHELAQRTGTEVLTAELAFGLRARGHEVAVFTWRPGALAERINDGGVPVVADPRRVPFVPEVIHGQHHLTTMAALTAWPDVPGLYFCHGVRPFDEQPPRHTRLHRYLSMAAINNGWLAATAGVAPDRVATVPNWFDPARFRAMDAVAAEGAFAAADRAALFNNRIGPGPLFEALAAGCAQQGLGLVGIGRGFDSATDSPETELRKYAVVFATGRSALEAMACGCSVIPLDAVAGLGSLVTPENFDEQRDRNWCVYQHPVEVTAEAVTAQLARRSSSSSAAVTRRVRTELTLDQAVRALESHYDHVVALPTTKDEAGVMGEREALVDYFSFLAARTHECDTAFREARHDARLAAKVPVLREEAAAVRRALAGLTRRLQASWWGRRFLRRHGGWRERSPESD
jgi:hypothetical protein